MEQAIQEAIELLKHVHIRMTPQRMAVLEYMYRTNSHPTADDIYRSLSKKFPNMSLATVYNNLHTLKQHGIIRELTYGDASSRYDWVDGEHYHVICERCGTIVDIETGKLDEIERLASAATGFEISGHRLELYGTCGECVNGKEAE